MSNYNFYELLILNLKLWGNFYSIIKTNERGEIIALLPYASPKAVQVYPVNWKPDKDRSDAAADFSDPEKLFADSYYYRDYRSRIYMPDQMFHIKSSAFNSSTGLIEGEDFATRVFNHTYEALSKLEAVMDNICNRDLRSPLLLTGLGYGEGKDIKKSSSETQKVKSALTNYFNGESQSGSSGVLAIPAGYDIKPLRTDSTSGILETLFDSTVSNLCSAWNVPRSLIFNSQNTERDSKQARREFISSGFKSMTRQIEDEFNRLSDWKVSYSYDLDSLRYLGADIREEAAIAQLQGVLSNQEIKEKIKKY